MPVNFATFWTGVTVGVAAFVGTAVALFTRRRTPEEEIALYAHRMPRDDRFTSRGLYWKKWNGRTLPPEALYTGTTQVKGKTVDIYIGQAPIDIIEGAGVQVGPIYDNDEYLTTNYDKIVHTNKKVKILCARSSTFYQNITWYPSQTEDLNPNIDFAIVGHELDPVTNQRRNLYVGKGRFGTAYLVGKVYMTERGLKFCPFFESQSLKVDAGFEVLGYTRN